MSNQILKYFIEIEWYYPIDVSISAKKMQQTIITCLLMNFTLKQKKSMLFYYLKLQLIQKMLNIRKQLQLLSNISQTILQYRLQQNESLIELIKQIRKKIRQMIQTQIYQQGIIQMLINKQNFQIKNKIISIIKSNQQQKNIQFYVQIRISAIQKCNCQIYNQQLWQFGIIIKNNVKNKKFKSISGIIQYIERILRSLQCLNILPHAKQQKNRFILDHKVTISNQSTSLSLAQFNNMSNQEVVIVRDDGQFIKKLTSKYFYNHKKIQQNIKQVILSKSLQMSGQSKKYSIDSTQASRRLSLYQFYDDQLDITVLSSDQSLSDQQTQQPSSSMMQNFQQQQFQILMEETVNEDQLFLNNNCDFFDHLKTLQNDYL